MKLQADQLAVFDQLLDAVVIVDGEGLIIYANEAGGLVFGKSLSRLVKKRHLQELATFDPPLTYNSTIETGQKFQPYREFSVKIDTSEKFLNLAYEQISIDGQSSFLIFIRDVTLERNLHEKYHKELAEKNKVLQLEMQQRVSLQLLTTELDRKIFEISCLLEFTQRTRLISDANHLFNEFIDFMIERYYLGGGFIIRENIVMDRVELNTVKGKAKRRLALNSFKELNDSTQTLKGQIQFNEITYFQPIPAQWKAIIDQVFSEEMSGILACPLGAQEASQGVVILAHTNLHHGLGEDDLKLTRSLISHVNVLLENTSLKHMSITDELTTLYNKRYFKISLTHEITKSINNEMPLSLLVFDIDHFKKFNDTYGHLTGDFVLKSVGQAIKQFCRGSDVAFRYGGEEFVVLLPNTPTDDAVICAERVRKGIETLKLAQDGNTFKVTVSIGVSTCPTFTTEGEELIRTADMALYAAKRGGRNNVKVYDPKGQENNQ